MLVQGVLYGMLHFFPGLHKQFLQQTFLCGTLTFPFDWDFLTCVELNS